MEPNPCKCPRLSLTCYQPGTAGFSEIGFVKVVILAGGLGTRISEETGTRPKPMVEIGGRARLWHIKKNYSDYGYHKFIICVGYKGETIQEFILNYFFHMF